MLTINEKFKRVVEKLLIFSLKESKARLSAAANVYPPNGFSKTDRVAPSRKKFPFSGGIDGGIMAEARALLVVGAREGGRVWGVDWISSPT